MTDVTYGGTLPGTDGSSLVVAGVRLVPATGPVPPPPPPPASGVVFAVAGIGVADGSFGSWIGHDILGAGTWCDNNDAQTQIATLQKGAEYGNWPDRLMDLAVGAIDKSRGESWSAAAAGAYTDRWTTSWKAIAKGWGTRTPGNLHVRFAHEMNGSWFSWGVKPGEEASFVAAFNLWASIGAKTLPGALPVWCPNDGTSGGMANPQNYWPSSAKVYGVDSYNAWPWVADQAAFDAKMRTVGVGLEWHRQQAAARGVPLAVCEWANNGQPQAQKNGGGGDTALYYQAMHAWAVAHAGPGPGQVKYLVLYNLETQFEVYPDTIQPAAAAAYRSLF